MNILVMQTMDDYPPGLIGTVAALFGRTIAKSHGVDWTLDAMIAEQQCEFFRRFDSRRDRVWVAMHEGCPRGAITIDGSGPENGEGRARLRFFILDESARGKGIGRSMFTQAMQFCRDQEFKRVFLTTLSGLDAARRLYESYGFNLLAETGQTFHGSRFVEQTLECNLE